MKKLTITLIAMLTFALFISTSSASVLEDAIQRGYDQWLTRYYTTSSFRPYDTLRRDEAAKFFVEFAETQNFRNTSTSTLQSCSFSDQKRVIEDLKPYVQDACRYNIIRGANGKYMPDQTLTNAQAVTILIRILDWLQSENGNHRADNYYSRAKSLWLDISKFSIKDNPTTRWNVMTLMYLSANSSLNNRGTSGNRDIDEILKELTDILSS